MNNGFVGMNPEELKRQIEYVYEKGLKLVARPMGEATVNFFAQLRYEWFSPKAVEFYNQHADRIINVINAVINSFYNTSKKIEEAYNIIADANGLPRFEANLPQTAFLALPTLSDNLDGQVGMDTVSVQYDLDYYEREVRIKLYNFDKLPQWLPLYDMNGDQQRAYRQMVVDLKTHFTEEFESLVGDLKKYMETEKKNINVSRFKAFEVLNIDVTKNDW